MKKKFKSQEGITLIALVITIIVMLILVAVTINMAINGGLFSYAGRATSETQEAKEEEKKLASGQVTVDGVLYNSINDYLDANKPLLGYEETAKDEDGILKANAIYESNGYTAVIPKGFKVVPGINGETSISAGLVITDEVDSEGKSIGNEFVWIPVTFTLGENSTKDENGLYSEFLAEFYRSEWENNARGTNLTDSTSYTEPYASGYTTSEGKTEAEEYYEMMRSVQENGGFYIGRYEAGLQDESGNPVARTYNDNGISKVVVKRDQYPYIYVEWGLTMSDYTSDIKNQGKGALYLSKHMYDGKDVGAISTLCYGVQWDAMLDFIKSEKNVTDSRGWGNYFSSTWAITRTTAKYKSEGGTWKLIDDEVNDTKEKSSGESILLTTGASDVFSAKNIYDVAGNAPEWTNEAFDSKYIVCRVSRGGTYTDYDYGTQYFASSRMQKYGGEGFRPTLYIK